ncbi:restriction endonuclease subunit S [Bacteroides finegoldii]|uniref:Restriction endonuclease subunit S n=1 Tax=Bacteroides finegoldii TaxID=338188 RepID=A0AB34BPX6_9BACE|nr:restriction endonuclease subunit S [Bacteroides finegoldii]KAA5240678.1 restriction endonuclease subunit S [Bacteroides finegoldii]KAA5254672.1 restriction endonuclease subunit S [Bacteroides finegoldii]KAA5258376.1 restriction endonuclease subunit S [Bacteroides finegoldii]
MKCIDEESPFEIPKGWEWSKLSNVIELLSGQDFIPEKYNSSNQGIPYITGASNIVNGNLAINRWTETPTVIGKLGDLLIVCKGSGVGKMCICNVDKIHIARQIQIIRNFSNAISLSYVKSVVEANLQTIISNAQGVIPGISREHILNLLIPLPPTNEQYEIDKKLQEILPFIDRYAKSQEALDKLNVELLGNLKKSILQEAVQGRLVQQIAEEGTGEELLEQIKLEKQQLIKEGKLKKSALTDSVIFRGDDNKYYERINAQTVEIELPFEYPNNWSVLRLKDICQLIDGEKRNGKGICLDAKYLRGKSSATIVEKGKFVYAGDNIILVDGENSGEVFTVPQDGYMGSTFKQLWLSSAMWKPYILAFILFYKEDLRNSKRGAAIPHLNKELFYNLPIGIPPYQEQQRIAKRINELSQLLK